MSLTDKLKRTLVLLTLASLYACGGGGGVSQLVGQFIDDPVAGLNYTCVTGTQSITGITDSLGNFNYFPGQVCSFKVGNVTLGPQVQVPSDGKITPQDVAGVSRSATSSPSAIAIARFLQSLNDGSAAGKIVISATTTNALNNAPAISLVSSNGVISQAELTNLVVNVAGKTIVSESTAKAALDTQIATGVIVPSVGNINASTPVVLNSISVLTTSPSNPAGFTGKLTATGFYSDGSTKDLTSDVTWSSSDSSLLTVDSSGATKGLKKGVATLTASFTPQGANIAIKGSTLQVTTDPILQSLAITNSASPPAGLTDQLKATGTYSDGSTADLTKSVTWTSSDNTTLTIDSNGLVTGLVKGSATVAASIAGSSGATHVNSTFVETVVDPSPVSLALYFLQSSISSIQSAANTFINAVLTLSNKQTQTVSGLASWKVTPTVNGGGATVAVDATKNTAAMSGTSNGSMSISASYSGVNSSNALQVNVAQFINDPVVGLTYICTGGDQIISGITNEQGFFNYLTDQTCTFKVGNVTLGSVSVMPTDNKVTPQDLAGIARVAVNTPSAVVVAQFLQSLNDGSAAGKVVINSATEAALKNAPAVTLASSTGAISPSDLENIVTNIAGKKLVTQKVAQDSLLASISSGFISTVIGVGSYKSGSKLISIEVVKSAPTKPAGYTERYAAYGYFSDGKIENLTSLAQWTVSDSTLVSNIDSSGLATWLKKGTSTVTATYTGIKGSTPQVTTDPILQSLAITNSASPPAGLTDQLKATGTYSDGSTADLTKSVTWTSSDNTTLTIDSNGLAKGLVRGAAVVTASLAALGNSNPITVTFTESVLDPSPLNIVISYITSGITSIQNAASTLLNAVLNFTNSTSQVVSSAVTWAVSSISGGGNGSVTVDKTANSVTIKGTSPGAVSIVASYLGLNSNSLSMTVNALPPTVQNSSVMLNVLGVAASTVNGSIAATDPQGLPLSFSILNNGSVGSASIVASSGAFSFSIAGHTSAVSDVFTVTVSNGAVSSVASVNVTLNSDPLIQNQWHIQNVGYSAFASVLPIAGNDMNVAGAWSQGYTGKGVKVAVVDDGLEISHEDLAGNVDITNSRNFKNGSTNPTPSIAGDDHGTKVAGIIGSVAFNGKGGRGVAYGVTLRGYNLLGDGVSSSITNFGNALGLATYSSDNDIFNQSFGNSPTNLDPTSTSYNAINSNLMTMRNGKGAILVQSAGNEFVSFKDGTNVCSVANVYGVSCGNTATDTRRGGTLPIVVGATNSDGLKSSYSTTGSGIWISAPGGEYGRDSQYTSGLNAINYKPAIVTTALTGCQNASFGSTRVNALDSQGQNSKASNCQYTALMNGTSSAAPNLSGVIALMLEANSNLSYRDVKHILANTAKKIDPDFAGTSSSTLLTGSTIVLDQGWFKNAANYWFSNWYGFGSVDASAAVAMAKAYNSYLPDSQTASLAMRYTSNYNIPNANTTGATLSFAMAPTFSKVEQVIAFININTSPALTCNQIELTSPSGTKSILMHAANGFSSNGVLQTSIPGSRFLSNAFYGETASGTWTLRFLDFCNSSSRTSILSSQSQTLLISGH